MPHYNYECSICGHVQEEIHSIKDCDTIIVNCVMCNRVSERLINMPHIEGSCIYPFRLWNLDLGNQKDILIRDKAHHKKVLYARGLDSPSLHVGG